MLRICSCFALLLVLALPVGAAELRGTLRVIDGDTVDVGDTRVRLHGIDAPERGQPCTTRTGQNWACGDWVTQQVRDRYQGVQAVCQALDRDRYGRVVAKCLVDGADIGKVMVEEGLVFAYRRYSYAYDLEEKNALIARRGIHDFAMQAPARYRLGRIKGREAPDAGCRIKGNINAKGQHIYHMPGQAFYQWTGIQPARGERWFCTEAQARASGWRRARR